MNKVFMIGRLSADPISRNTASNLQIANIQLASEDNRDKNKTYFFGCTAFGTTAQYILNYLKKGDQVAVDARLTKNSYQTKAGTQASSTDIIIESVQLIAKSAKNNTVETSTSPIVEKEAPAKVEESNEAVE
jgi:single-strand DNA-binding protein